MAQERSEVLWKTHLQRSLKGPPRRTLHPGAKKGHSALFVGPVKESSEISGLQAKKMSDGITLMSDQDRVSIVVRGWKRSEPPYWQGHSMMATLLEWQGMQFAPSSPYHYCC